MECNSFINNIFLYLLSLLNSINYIFYFPFILFYLLELEKIEIISSIKIYVFFIIYDLVINIFINPIQKLLYCIGINIKISFDLIILFLINIALFYLFSHYDNKRFILDIIIIIRVIISLTNTSRLFISKLLENMFERKEIFKKLNNFEFYEKINNFIIFIFIFIFINSFHKLYFYFFVSSIFNLCFFIFYLLMFRCHNEKNYDFYDEQELNSTKNNNKYKNNNNKRNIKIKNSYRLKNTNIKNTISNGDFNSLSKSNNKDIFNNKHRKTSTDIISNGKFEKKKYNNLEKKKTDIDNLSTNNNQIIINKESTKEILGNNNDNLDNNIHFQNKDLDIINNIPITSSNRGLNDNSSKITTTLTESKNDNILNKKKWIFIVFILIPSKFLKYLFLIMLFLKTHSLKNNFTIKVHLFFYCCYFLMNILIYPLNKGVFTKIIKREKGKKVMYILSILFAIPACIGYIYLILDDKIMNEKKQILKYILLFVLNFILKESLFILFRIFYINIIILGFNQKMLKTMKEISNYLACLLFLGYTVLLLFMNNDTIILKIIKYILYYFIPLFFIILFFIYTINIS